MENEERNRLENLQKKLYSKNAPNVIGDDRSGFKSDSDFDYENENRESLGVENEIGKKWGDAKSGSFDELAAKVSHLAGKKHSVIKKLFIFSIGFFILACGAAAFVFFGGINMISSKNVDIKVSGPLSVGGGQETSFDIIVYNNNSANLQSATLVIEYPDGARSADDISKTLSQEKFSLGNIKSGDSYTQNVKAVFFGDQGNALQMKISLEYTVANSSATFTKEKDYDFSISSAPIIVTPTYPKEINSNQEFEMSIEVASNSKNKLSDFLVNVEYPFGFVFDGASPNADFSNNVWKLSDLEPGDKKTILIKGTIVGQDNEEKVFKINSGTASADDERLIGVAFSQLTETVSIKKPFIGLNVSVGDSNEESVVGKGGQEMATKIKVSNNLTDQIFNASVEVALSGGAFDKNNVNPSYSGFFQSSSNKISWDKRTVSNFETLDPGSSQELTFNLTPLIYSKVSQNAKPEIDITVTVKGERILESGSSETVSNTETRKIILGTDLSLTAKTMRSVGNIENSGPVPPQADTPTTYTIVWDISNTFNQVSNAEVRATLPSYVEWTGIYEPSSESLSYDSTNHQMVWKAGSVLSGVGVNSSSKEVRFQVKFLPSVNQIGQVPVLVDAASLTAIDKVTGAKIETSAPEVTINFYGDSTFKSGDDRVKE